MLRLTHVTQLDQGVANMCFQAVFGLKWQWLTGEYVTALTVARRTNTDDGTFTEPRYEIPRIYRTYGVQWHHEGAATWDWWVERIASGRPAAALVHYGKLIGSTRDADQFAHFCLPVGIEGDTVWIHDPLKRTGPTAYSVAAFRASIETVSPGNLYATQAYVMDSERRISMTGINVDLRNPMGRPDVARLSGFTHVRLLYNLSNGAGSVDIDAAEAVYRPYINALVTARIQPVVVFTHQTWGEGQGFNWEAMTGEDWGRFRTGLVAMIARIAERYKGLGLVYQIHNEQDSQDSRASVVMPPDEYGLLFNAAYTRIRGIDGTAQIITGGHNSGPGDGGAYFVASGIQTCDGVGIHPYGAGAGGLFEIYGTIDAQLRAWRQVIPSLPLWVTEYGLTNAHHEPEPKVAQYARAFRAACNGKARAPMWYAWSDYMDNSYGVLSNAGQERAELREALTAQISTPQPVTGYAAGAYRLNYPGGRVNVRSGPSTSAGIVGTVGHGEPVDVLDAAVTTDGKWSFQRVQGGYMATKGGAWTLAPRTVDSEAWAMVKQAHALLGAALVRAGVE